MLSTRNPFRTREHPLEARRNCSSSHTGGIATKLSSIQRNAPFMNSSSWPKRVPIVLEGTIKGPMPIAESTVPGRAAPRLPTSWADGKTTLSAGKEVKANKRRKGRPCRLY
jgi:hypothetical protein